MNNQLPHLRLTLDFSMKLYYSYNSTYHRFGVNYIVNYVYLPHYYMTF